MSKTKVSYQYAVRTPDGKLERISENAANEGYMSALEYAKVRAQVTGGTVVSRTKTVDYTEWSE